jgi:hypothetical protein
MHTVLLMGCAGYISAKMTAVGMNNHENSLSKDILSCNHAQCDRIQFRFRIIRS